jgi:hypothetical protein
VGWKEVLVETTQQDDFLAMGQYADVPLASEEPRGKHDFCEEIAASLKIIEPFAVKGAGGRLHARVAGRMALYLESGAGHRSCLLYPRTALLLSEGQLCHLCYSVTDNQRKEVWQLRGKKILRKKEKGETSG